MLVNVPYMEHMGMVIGLTHAQLDPGDFWSRFWPLDAFGKPCSNPLEKIKTLYISRQHFDIVEYVTICHLLFISCRLFLDHLRIYGFWWFSEHHHATVWDHRDHWDLWNHIKSLAVSAKLKKLLLPKKMSHDYSNLKPNLNLNLEDMNNICRTPHISAMLGFLTHPPFGLFLHGLVPILFWPPPAKKSHCLQVS